MPTKRPCRTSQLRCCVQSNMNTALNVMSIRLYQTYQVEVFWSTLRILSRLCIYCMYTVYWYILIDFVRSETKALLPAAPYPTSLDTKNATFKRHREKCCHLKSRDMFQNTSDFHGFMHSISKKLISQLLCVLSHPQASIGVCLACHAHN